ATFGAEVVVYANESGVARNVKSSPSNATLRGFPAAGTEVCAGACLGRIRFTGRVLSKDFEALVPEVASVIEETRRLALAPRTSSRTLASATSRVPQLPM